jgi:hypothetical protein
MEKVISVYIATKESNSNNSKELQKLFDTKLFKINVIEFESNPNLSKLENDLNQLKWVIHDSDEKDTVLFIKDECNVSINTSNFEKSIKDILNKEWDVCLLSVDPSLISENRVINNFSALLLNQKSKKEIITYDKKELKDQHSFFTHLHNNKMKTIFVYPNLFSNFENSSEIKFDMEDKEKYIKYENLPNLPNLPPSNDPQVNDMIKSMYNQRMDSNLKLILVFLIVIVVAVFIYWYYQKNLKNKSM